MANDPQAAMRKELIAALNGGNAHAQFEDVIADFPAKLRGEKAGLPYSAWQLLEHIRIAQNDIVRFCGNQDGRYKELNFPGDFWPKSAEPPNAKAWESSVEQVKKDRDEMVAMIGDLEREVAAPFHWGEGQTLLREAVLLIDHNAYHVGELLALRRLLGTWPAKKRNKLQAA